MRHTTIKHIDQVEAFKEKLLHWGQQFEELTLLDSNNYSQEYTDYDLVVAVDAFTVLQTDDEDAFLKLEEYQQTTSDWIFGYLTYDLKNDTEKLSSTNYDGLNFPDLFFFQPKRLFFVKGNEVTIAYLNVVADEIENDWEEIESTKIRETQPNLSLQISSRLSQEEYIAKFEKIKAHITRGDIYEVNFCQEFYAENTHINPVEVYGKLNNLSAPPFATFFKNGINYLLSASPERYLKKSGNRIVSQPIKGTAKRADFIEEDEAFKKALAKNEKERSENIMIVDLVRNDLAKTAKKGSVQVAELCKVYTFKQVHQMISTVVAELKDEVSPVSVIRTTFPMGSMTGAPKVSAMKIIEQIEVSKRGLYSGCVGYFTPDNDFDFNVIIRSILYNEKAKYVSFSVGGAITAKSEAHSEYEECLLKAYAMQQALTN